MQSSLKSLKRGTGRISDLL